MKKVYIPTEEELRKIEDITKSSQHTYKYILAKAIETLLMEKVLEPKKNLLELAYEHFEEFPDIIYAICKTYPIEKLGCVLAENDTRLCIRLLRDINNKKENINISRAKELDDLLEYFSHGMGVLDNHPVINETTTTLANVLQAYPNYRYEYKDNRLLDEIFSCSMSELPIRPTESFITIDPIYSVKITKFDYNFEYRKESIVRENIDSYANRNGISSHDIDSFSQKGLMEKPNEKTKKLIRCLEYHKRKYQ